MSKLLNRKKEYDFKSSDLACDHAFDIVNKREAKERKAKEEITKDGVNEPKNDREHIVQTENGDKDANVVVEPVQKKKKFEDDTKIGCITDEDMIPLKPKVVDLIPTHIFLNIPSDGGGWRRNGI